MFSYCCWLTQRCESECFRAPRRHPKVQNIRKHRRTPGNAFSVVLDASPSTRRLQKQWFFQIALSPSLGWPLAGFGRYSGVRKLVPGGTFWAHSGPQRDKNTQQQKTRHVFENPSPPSPNVAPGNCLFCGVRRGHAVRRRGGAARRSRAARPARRGLRGAACDARRRPAATPQGVARGGTARAAARGGALDQLSNIPSRKTETTSKAELDNETELGKSKCERRKQAKPVSARR